MYQPYPSSGKPVEPERPPAPPSVLNAVKLMYVGAAVTTVDLVLFLINVGAIKDANKKAHSSLTAAQLNNFIVSNVIYAVISVALWLWMARANSQGQNWARITSTVLFGLSTLDLYVALNLPKTVIGLAFLLLTWLAGLGAVILLWRKESTAFFKPRQFV
jgi:hypothetical protein